MSFLESMPLEFYYVLYVVPLVLLSIFLFYRNHVPRPWPTPNDFFKIFSKEVQSDMFWGGNKDFQAMLLKIMEAYNEYQQAQKLEAKSVTAPPSAILIDCGKTKFQMIAFYNHESATKKQRGLALSLYKGLPMIPIARWGHSSNRTSAMTFLRESISTATTTPTPTPTTTKVQKDSKEEPAIVKITCPSEDLFRALFEHLAPTCRYTEEVDLPSRCKIYSGFLSPKKV